MTVSLQRECKFPRELRLLTPSQFSFVFANAIPCGSQYFTFLARFNETIDHPRLGITIAKKKVKKAVHRNRIKRVVRESFRQHAYSLHNVDIIVLAKAGCDTLANDELHTVVQQNWKRLKKKCQSATL